MSNRALYYNPKFSKDVYIIIMQTCIHYTYSHHVYTCTAHVTLIVLAVHVFAACTCTCIQTIFWGNFCILCTGCIICIHYTCRIVTYLYLYLSQVRHSIIIHVHVYSKIYQVSHMLVLCYKVERQHLTSMWLQCTLTCASYRFNS